MGTQATDEWVGETVTVGPNDTVISASGMALSLAAASEYPLLPVGDLIAALQGGKAYGTATLPTGERVPTSGRTPSGMFDVAQPFTVDVTAAVIRYLLVYSDDRTLYWEPVVIFQGMVCQAADGWTRSHRDVPHHRRPRVRYSPFMHTGVIHGPCHGRQRAARRIGR